MTEIAVKFTPAELDEIVSMMSEVAMQMDDDGREGAFDASPLAPIYRKICIARKAGR